MNSRKMSACVVLLALSMIVSNASAGDGGRGGDAGAFLRMGLDARSLALGGSTPALFGDGYALYANPAGLVYLNGRWGGASLRSMSLDRRLTYLGYAQSIGPETSEPGQMRGGLGLGWISSGVSDIDGRDFSGQHTEMLWAGEHAFCFGFALRPHPKMAIGVTGKLVYSRMGGVQDDGGALSARGFGFDLGVMLRPFENLTLGAVVKDLRTAYTWDTQEIYDMGTQTVDHFPTRAELGLAWTHRPLGLLLSLGAEKIDLRPWQVHGGVAYQLMKMATLRAGLRYGKPAFGFGIKLVKGHAHILLDYALVTDSVAPSPDHLISWSVLF